MATATKTETYCYIDVPVEGHVFPKTTVKFDATGRASSDCKPLSGVLKKQGSAVEYPGTTIQQPQPGAPRWIINFDLSTPEKPDPKAKYNLIIYRDGDETDTLAESDDIAFSGDQKEAQKRAVFTSTPSSGGQYCSNNFTAQGSLTDPDYTIASAILVPVSGGNPISSRTPVVFNETWLAAWDTVPDGIYNLYVTGNGGGQSTVTNIDIEAQYCST